MSTPTPLDIMNSRYLKKETGLVKMANKFYDNPISGI
jgi:hypothetical protein